MFFPEKGWKASSSINEGKKICFGCPVRSECKDYRERTGSDYGIWGGELEKRPEKKGGKS